MSDRAYLEHHQPVMDGDRHRLLTLGRCREYVLAGKAVLTLVSAKTGTRFTYRVKRALEGNRPQPRLYVAVLTGPDNVGHYEFLGTLFEEERPWPARYRHGHRSRIAPDAPSARAWAWFWEALTRAPSLPSDLEVWHEGRCGRCGRRLTVPESIATGLGPECAGKIASADHQRALAFASPR